MCKKIIRDIAFERKYVIIIRQNILQLLALTWRSYMNTTIRFPHMGLTLNPGKSFTVFGLEIAYYGIIIGIGMLVGALVAYREAKKT